MKLKTILILLAVSIVGCNNDDDEAAQVQQLSDEQITLNLIEYADAGAGINPELLIGEWDVVKFAYTADGKEISNVATVSGAWLKIPVEFNLGEEAWLLHCLNSAFYACSISGNLIEFEPLGSTYIYVPTPHLEFDMEFALDNAYSFVIKGNELIIYFKKIDDKDSLSKCTVIKNKNLLIFKKR